MPLHTRSPQRLPLPSRASSPPLAAAVPSAAPSPQDGRTALYLAAQQGHLGLIDTLLAMGADIHMKDNKVPLRHLIAPGSTPPPTHHTHGRRPRGSTNACIVSHSPDPASWPHHHMSTPAATTASRPNHRPVHRCLRTRRLQPRPTPPTDHYRRAQGLTPLLHFAAENNKLAALQHLVKKGADVTARLAVHAPQDLRSRRIPSPPARALYPSHPCHLTPPSPP